MEENGRKEPVKIFVRLMKTALTRILPFTCKIVSSYDTPAMCKAVTNEFVSFFYRAL